MTWQNPIPDSLWYTELPMPAFIAFDGTNYTLRVGGQSFVYQDLGSAQTQYEAVAISRLVPDFNVAPQLPAFSLPTDGQSIGIWLISGGFAYGTWSASAATVEQTAQTIPLSDIAVWTSLASPP